MFKIFKKIYIYIFLSILLTYGFAAQINVLDLKTNSTDFIETDSNTIFSLFQSINKLLWFIVGVIVMAILVYIGLILIKSEGREEDIKEMKNRLKGIGIGIIFILLAAAIISAVVTLFR